MLESVLSVRSVAVVWLFSGAKSLHRGHKKAARLACSGAAGGAGAGAGGVSGSALGQREDFGTLAQFVQVVRPPLEHGAALF